MGNYYAPFSLRISETLITKLKIIAIENKRSTNKEMEYALEKYVNMKRRMGKFLCKDTPRPRCTDCFAVRASGPFILQHYRAVHK